LKAGNPCPDARCRGKVYPQRDPGVLVRIKGQAPIAATVYELEKLRCNLCGDVFTAAAPEGVGEKKYDETAASMIALLRYGSGVPWYRLQGLEKSLGIPLPVATQCEIVAETAAILQPALQELKRQAAQGEVVHNDDTSMRVLSLDRDADIGADRSIHQWDCMDLPGAADPAVFHRVQTRRREPGRDDEATACRPAATDSDVRRPIEECAKGGRRVRHTDGQLSGARSEELRGGDAEFSR
jgi:transposase